MKRLLPTAALLLVSVAAGGCRSSRGGTNTVTYKPAASDRPQSFITDNDLAGVARVVDANAFRRGDTLQAQVRVENATGRQQRFVSQWVWYEGEFESKTLENDRVRTIGPRETLTLNGTAPNPDVDGFQLKLSPAD